MGTRAVALCASYRLDMQKDNKLSDQELVIIISYGLHRILAITTGQAGGPNNVISQCHASDSETPS